MDLTKRLDKGIPLTFQEMDDNWDYLMQQISSANANIAAFVSGFKSGLDTNTAAISSLQTSNSTNASAITSVQSSLTTLQNSLTAVQAALMTLSNDDTTTAAHFTSVEKEISDNATKASSDLSAQVTSLNTRIDNINGLLQTAQTNISNLQTSDANTAQTISTIQTQLTSATTSITSLQTSLTNLTTTVTTNGNSLSALQTTVGNKADTSYVDTQIATREALNHLATKVVDTASRADQAFVLYDLVNDKYIHKTASAMGLSSGGSGGDEIATVTPSANAIPKAGSSGTLDIGWLPVLTGFSAASGGNVSASDTVLTALQKLEYRTALDDAKTSFPGFSTATPSASTSAGSVGTDPMPPHADHSHPLPKVTYGICWYFQTISTSDPQPAYEIRAASTLKGIRAHQDSGSSSFSSACVLTLYKNKSSWKTLTMPTTWTNDDWVSILSGLSDQLAVGDSLKILPTTTGTGYSQIMVELEIEQVAHA